MELRLTQAQEEVRAAAIRMLGEHFDAFVLVTETDCGNDEEGEPVTIMHGAYEGGCSRAIGLCEKYKRDLLRPRVREE